MSEQHSTGNGRTERQSTDPAPGGRRASGTVAVLSAIVCSVGVIVLPRVYNEVSGGQALENGYYLSQIVVMFFVALGVVFALRQIERARQATQAALFEATGTRIFELSRLMLENSDVVTDLRFEASDSTRWERADLLAQANLDVFDTILLERQIYSELVSRFPTIEKWVIDSFEEYPVIRETLVRRRAWYSFQLYSMAIRSKLIQDVGEGHSWGESKIEIINTRWFEQLRRGRRSRLVYGQWGWLPGDRATDETGRVFEIQSRVVEAFSDTEKPAYWVRELA